MSALAARPGLSDALHAFLRGGGHRGVEWSSLPRHSPFTLIVLCGAAYGAVMSSYNGIAGERWLMVLYGALKVPMLFMATMLIAIPCFYVLNLLAGAGADFRRVWQGLIDYQLSIAVQLFALIPVTAFFNVIYADYRLAQAWSTLLFAFASWNARRSLNACYAPLIARSPAHRHLRRFWFLLYAFVGIQMGWDLRPFVGHPEMPVQFFREGIGNAYVNVAIILKLFVQEQFVTIFRGT
jgi:hypothetical protein